jgi:hypothetical protein
MMLEEKLVNTMYRIADTMNKFLEALRKEFQLKAAVQAWMKAEGAEGNLRQNSDAPAWTAYEQALNERTRLMHELGTHLLTLPEGTTLADDPPPPTSAGLAELEVRMLAARVADQTTKEGTSLPAPMEHAPRTTDYCAVCGKSPDAAEHLPSGHNYVPPWWRAKRS